MMSQAVARRDEAGGYLSFIERALHDDSITIEKLESLLRMQHMVAAEQARREFNFAMSEAQSEMMPIIRDATNTHTGSKYARLGTIVAQMQPIWTKHGFGVRFGSEPSPHEGWTRVNCTVSHTGGHEEVSHLDAPPDSAGQQGRSNKTPVQAVGSTVTYLRRYLVTMVFNIVLADDDDDGESQRNYQRPNGAARAAPSSAQPSHLKLSLLNERNGTVWLKNLEGLLKSCQSLDEVQQIATHSTVGAVLKADSTAPTMVRANVRDFLKEAHERLAPQPDETQQEDAGQTWDDPIASLLADVAGFDLVTLDGLARNAAWQKKVEELFPPDADRVREAIETRRIALKAGGNAA